MGETQGQGSSGLRPSFTPLGIWAFSIGTSIGWGSFIVTCNTYLSKSGILGTIFGLLIGMAVILVITWNLQYMIRNSPDAGGIYTFEKRVGGKDFGFLAGWFVLLTYLAILWANITSLPLFSKFFLGNIFQFGFHYQVFGYEVWLGEALLSIVAVVLIGLLCSRSSRVPNRIMAIAALVFVLGFTVCAIIAIVGHDNSFSYTPLYTEGSDAFGQIIRIAAISPWAFIGFENIAHFSEEYTFPVKRVRRILIWSVVLTTLLYLFVSLLSISAYPPQYDSWLAYIQDMGSLSGIEAVPAFYAANYYLGQTGVAVLMLSLFAVILTSLIGNMMAVSRLLFAAGREGDAPQQFKMLNKHGIPAKAILAIVVVSAVIPFLGRTAIGWIVDVTTIGATLIYGMISHAVYLHAKGTEHKPEQYTGIFGIVLMLCFLLLVLVPGLLPFHAMETESYVLFIIWAALGLLYYRFLLRRDESRDYSHRIVVWVILLVLMLFASMMWVSRATETAADEAVQRIYEYHQTHPEPDSAEVEAEDRSAYLQEQADTIARTNTLFTIVSLGIVLVSIIIMLNNYRDTRMLGERLTVAEREMRDAKRIAALKESITSLLDNMPALSFSKDAETGVYLACNQGFAEYAHKESPDGVVGLTDAEIFDPETAKHFMEDDRMALSMDEPYTFFEDVPDAAGNQKQFRTTKLKYIDTAGRLCLLGMCQDVTDLVRAQREHESTKEAYENVRRTGLVYTRIAQALARSYTDLFYVELDTDDFVEYVTDDEFGRLTEARRGEHFFDECKIEAEMYLHPDDRETFVKAMDKQTLLDALDRNKIFILTYRLLAENGSRYTSMRVSRMEDDERVIIIGVSDVDEEMRNRQAVELMEQESLAYTRLSALTGEIICAYIVDPETDRYREYSASMDFENFALPKDGTDFFNVVRRDAHTFNHPDDLERFLSLFTKENVLSEIERSGIFSLSYRLLIEGEPSYVRLKAAMIEEEEGLRLIVGINDVNAQVRQEEEYSKRLAQVQRDAHIDALTGVKNRHSYLDAEDQLDRQIAEHRAPEFAIVILDVNDLKKVNDVEGHKAGDQYLRDARKIICDIFKHSPVFRVGGDEFAIISQGDDYEHIDELLEEMSAHNAEAARTGGIVIACGMAKFDGDSCVAPVFERADLNMYENKSSLKASNDSE